MLIEEALILLLQGDTATAALIAKRIYPNVVPLNTLMPAIAYQTVNGLPDYSHDGFSGLTQTYIQLTCEADDYATAKHLAQTVRKTLGGYLGKPGGTLGDVTIEAAYISGDIDGYNETKLAPVVRLEVELWHDAP